MLPPGISPAPSAIGAGSSGRRRADCTGHVIARFCVRAGLFAASFSEMMSVLKIIKKL